MRQFPYKHTADFTFIFCCTLLQQKDTLYFQEQLCSLIAFKVEFGLNAMVCSAVICINPLAQRTIVWQHTV